MLDSNIILNLKKGFAEREYSHGILTQELERWPCATPIVYPKCSLDKESSVITASLFPPSMSGGGGHHYHAPTSIISPVDLKPLYKNHKVITVPRFDTGKTDRLMEYVKDVGAITLVVDSDLHRPAVANALEGMANRYRYNSLYHYNGWNRFLSGDDDAYVAILTILDLPYCVPLFNMRKVDGVGIKLSGATVEQSKRAGQLDRTLAVDVVLSNFEDNLFFIDGVQISQPNSIGRDIYEEIRIVLAKELPVKKVSIKEKKSGAGYDSRDEIRSGFVHKKKENSDGTKVEIKYFKQNFANPTEEWVLPENLHEGTLVVPSEAPEPSDEVILDTEAQVQFGSSSSAAQWTTTFSADSSFTSNSSDDDN